MFAKHPPEPAEVWASLMAWSHPCKSGNPGQQYLAQRQLETWGAEMRLGRLGERGGALCCVSWFSHPQHKILRLASLFSLIWSKVLQGKAFQINPEN